MQATNTSTTLLKNLLNETFTLLLATLIFYVFVLPAMISMSVTSWLPRKPDRYVWVSVIPHPKRNSPRVGAEIGLYIRDADSDPSHCFEERLSGSGKVDWGLVPGPRYTFRLLNSNSTELFLGAWVAEFGDPSFAGAPVGEPIKLVFYPDSQATDVHAEIDSGSLGKDRYIIELSPSNSYQYENKIPLEFLERR